MSAPQNPKWRYTWETLASIPNLRLFLFNPNINPANQCKDLKVSLNFEESLLLVSWNEETTPRANGSADFLLKIPIPRVLVDLSSLVDFRATEDHIGVKLVLVVPINHPLLMNFDLGFNLSYGGSRRLETSLEQFQHLSLDSDMKYLTSQDGVHFYCKKCSIKLTKRPLRSFVEMPSVDWREVADNWFGTCCCSFGGISEKLVNNYAISYTSAEGTCMIDATSVIVSKNDLANCVFRDYRDAGENDSDRSDLVSEENVAPSHGLLVKNQNHCCVDMTDHVGNHEYEDCSHDSITSSLGQESTKTTEILKNCQFLLNGSLGNSFMFKTSNLSKEIEWIEFRCTQCSSVVGAYPSATATGDLAPIDGGVRLFKCYTSTGVPTSGPGNIFRNYTLQRMFINRLMESANDELSFRTVVKDLKTRSPMLQIVLLNSDAWSCTGYCIERRDNEELVLKIKLHPVVKVLFSDCTNATDAQSRMIKEWETKNQADEIYMLRHQVEELTESLKSTQDRLPFSCSLIQGMSLSAIER
ncbi:hypothetical protein GIB67_004876 [Kingdonia uniflora]|uniref:Ubiquitin-conjugating enzyme E2C-binding protein n=1 Tax=Kingdonia uniflora TaxID=39325 RepID=A0A7J7LNJ6_9MAGN|nr:hypothetical protein GIB67_004876 [Kingdonia uniflora]